MKKIAESKVSAAMLVNVPQAIRLALGIGPGDYIEWHVEDDTILVKKRSNCKNKKEASN